MVRHLYVTGFGKELDYQSKTDYRTQRPFTTLETTKSGLIAGIGLRKK